MRRAILFCGSIGLLSSCLRSAEVKQTPVGLPRMPSGTYTLAHNNLPRRYTLHLPKGKEYENNLALVVALHGAPGTAKNLEENSLLSQKADAAGFIVVYPDGTSIGDPNNKDWNYWNCCNYTGDKNPGEVAFIRRLVETLAREYHVDRRKIYATGFSRGGMMSELLACEASDLFTGIADVAGSMNFDTCKPKFPMDVILIHGRNDRNVIFGGSAPKKLVPLLPGEDRPVAYAVETWKKNNHCRSGKTLTRGNVERTDYRCSRGALRLIALSNEGHSWPGSLPGMIGTEKPSQEISTPDEIWSFWARAAKRHGKQRRAHPGATKTGTRPVAAE